MPKLTYNKAATGSAPELDPILVITNQESQPQPLRAVNQKSDKQLTASSKSLKPMSRGQIFRKQQAQNKDSQGSNEATHSNEPMTATGGMLFKDSSTQIIVGQ